MNDGKANRASDTGLRPDPVAGFGYCQELPPDVPPGMTLAQWRRRTAHRRDARRRLRAVSLGRHRAA